MKLFGIKFNIYLVIASIALLLILSGSTTCGCMKKSPMEAMTLLKNSDKFITKFNVDKLEKVANMYETSHNGSTNSMLLWANNGFSKDCCLSNQSNYYNRKGCVCATQEQVDFLSSRGNNHK
tara:strand:- start:320 stop:685 length:366 start_codon:yes stop_codon:yes gene_type:complete